MLTCFDWVRPLFTGTCLRMSSRAAPLRNLRYPQNAVVRVAPGDDNSEECRASAARFGLQAALTIVCSTFREGPGDCVCSEDTSCKTARGSGRCSVTQQIAMYLRHALPNSFNSWQKVLLDTSAPAPGATDTCGVGRNAVVLGAGMAGLMAACCLRDSFDTVYVFDKDRSDLSVEAKISGGKVRSRCTTQPSSRSTSWQGGAEP